MQLMRLLLVCLMLGSSGSVFAMGDMYPTPDESDREGRNQRCDPSDPFDEDCSRTPTPTTQASPWPSGPIGNPGGPIVPLPGGNCNGYDCPDPGSQCPSGTYKCWFINGGHCHTPGSNH